MALKRSITYKDPQHTKQPNMQLWNLINQLPEYQVAKVIRPDILRNDKGKPNRAYRCAEACQLIQQKIESEKRTEQLQQLWYQNNRDNIRTKFFQRHE